MDLIKIAEQAFATKNEFPDFIPGDTVTVAYRIKEGNKERIQQYRGVVIKINGEGDKKRFTVRKISDGIGAYLPNGFAFYRQHCSEQARPCASRQALLPAQAHRQEGSHQGASCRYQEGGLSKRLARKILIFFETATACVAVFFIRSAAMKKKLPKELSAFSLSWEEYERLPVLHICSTQVGCKNYSRWQLPAAAVGRNRPRRPTVTFILRR